RRWSPSSRSRATRSRWRCRCRCAAFVRGAPAAARTARRCGWAVPAPTARPSATESTAPAAIRAYVLPVASAPSAATADLRGAGSQPVPRDSILLDPGRNVLDDGDIDVPRLLVFVRLALALADDEQVIEIGIALESGVLLVRKHL